MIVIPTKEIYKCEYCHKKHYSKGVMTRHEKWCTSNRINWDACLNCKHLVEGEIEVCRDGYSTRTAKMFVCEKLNKKLYPAKVEKKGLVKRYPETFADQERMPNECEYFEYGNSLGDW